MNHLKLLASFTIVLLLTIAADAPAKGKPLKVYVLVGQSNMEGQADLRVLDYLEEDPDTRGLHETMFDSEGNYATIPNTWISYLTGGPNGDDNGNREVTGPLQMGDGTQFRRDYSKPGTKIGPELGFGYAMQQFSREPVLIIKVAWGGQSLNIDFRSPSSGEYPKTEANANQFDTQEQRDRITARTGNRYRQMIEHVKHVLADISRVYPEYKSKSGYELSGFAWFQGWNDMVDRNTYPTREQPGGYDNYSKWLANFIRDVRKDLDAPAMPFAIGVMGIGGPIELHEERYQQIHDNFNTAMAAPALMDEFTGNVAAVQTNQFWDLELDAIDKKRGKVRQKEGQLKSKHPDHENADGSMSTEDIKAVIQAYQDRLITDEDLALEKRARSNAAYHYYGCATTYSKIGIALADAIADLETRRATAEADRPRNKR